MAAIEQTYTAHQAAAYLGIHIKTLYKYATDGTIPRSTYRKKPGNRYVFTESALRTLLEVWDTDARRGEPTPHAVTTTRDSRGRRRQPVYRD